MNSLVLLVALLSSVAAEVTLSNGQRVNGELTALSTESVTIAPGGGEKQSLARSALKEIQFPKPDGVDVASPKMRVFLSDQSTFPCESAVMAKGKLSIKSGFSTAWQADSPSVQAVRWFQPNEDTDDEWNEIASKVGADDLLVIRRQNLDYLKGVVLGINADAVEFEYSGNKIPVPLDKVAGVFFAQQAKELPTVRLRLATHDGGQWMLENANVEGKQIRVVTAAGMMASLPLDWVATIEYPQLGAVYLTDLEPDDMRIESLVGSTVLSETLKKFNGPRFDVAFDGEALRIASNKSDTGSQTFERGIALQSGTELVYRLAGKYQRFIATAGIAFDSASQADVELVVFADDRPAFRAKIRNEDEPIALDVDVRGARRLRLAVDYGANVDIGDRLHLGDARLLK